MEETFTAPRLRSLLGREAAVTPGSTHSRERASEGEKGREKEADFE